MNRRAVFIAAIFASASVSILARGEEPQPVRVAILFRTHKSYQTAASSLETALQATGCECTSIELPKSDDEPGRESALRRLTAARPTVIAAAGASATSFAVDKVPRIPVVFFMVPNARDAPFVVDGNPHKARVAGVAADVSPEDQINWISRLHPAIKNIGILHSSRTQRTVKAFKDAAERRRLTVTAIEADKGEFPEAVDALSAKGCDGVLMIPDAQVYNAATIKRLLLWGIRQKKPVWTFSASIVKAGAFAGQYADSEAVGRQAAELVRREIKGTPPSELGLQYPRYVGRAVNERTAEMIDVRLSSAVVGTDATRFGEQP
ncbi:MAG: hypothetical protein JXQ75_05205 [Phycisphaerae bacterium]|nr:hypothetical protein [Phycisphaerae bacterium]